MMDTFDRLDHELRAHLRGQDDADRAYEKYGQKAREAYVARKLNDARWVRQCIVDGEWMDQLAVVAYAAASQDFGPRLVSAAETLRREMVATAQQYAEIDADGEVVAAVWALYRQGDE